MTPVKPDEKNSKKKGTRLVEFLKKRINSASKKASKPDSTYISTGTT